MDVNCFHFENIRVLSEGGQNTIYDLPEIGAVLRQPKPDTEDTLCLPPNPELEFQLYNQLEATIKDNLADIGIHLLDAYGVYNEGLIVQKIVGNEPDIQDLISLIPKVIKIFTNYLENCSSDLWKNTTLDLACLFSKGFPIRTDNFIKSQEGKIYLIDPFMHIPNALEVTKILNMVFCS